MVFQENWVFKSKSIFLFAFIVVVFSCSSVFAQNFSNQTTSLAPGLAGGKVAWGDYNNDGYVDCVAGGNLWKNNAGAGFVSTGYSLGNGGLWADYDNDGKLDFFSYASRALSRNSSSGGNSSFSTVNFPLPMSRTRGASWADYDNDGKVDLYVTGYEIWDSVTAYNDAVIKNQGDTFTVQSNLNYQPARGVTSCDFDRDGYQDVFVSNYRLRENVLWQNNSGSGFSNVTISAGADEPESWAGYSGAHTIGAAWGDLDNDGNMDLFVGNFAHDAGFFSGWPRQPESQFLRNMGPDAQGNYHFEDKRATAGLAYQESYASPALGDYDNDGDLDLFLTTVYSYQSGTSIPNHSVLYRNDGDWNFTDVTAEEGLDNLGPTYQAAWADFDNDGDLDLITDGKLFVNDESDTGSNHWLKVKLTGDGTEVNGAAIGSEVRISVGGQVLTRQVEGGTGEGNQNDLTLHFGLGSYDGLVDLEIFAGEESWLIEGVSLDQTIEYTVPEPATISLVGITAIALISRKKYF